MSRAIGDLRHWPVTAVLGLAWVVVFGLMAWEHEGPFRLRSFLWGGFIGTDTSHAFGDVTPAAVYGGQWWRALTATFVHFNLIHLVLNLVAFVQLGRVLESWYKSGLFLGLYAAIGVLANVGANLLRPWVAGPSAMGMHSGGGSTVVLGLIGLVTVVGWRNPKEFPSKARFWLVAILAANGALGLIVPNIDNLGHAAGAAAGGLIGLLDRRLLRLVDSRWRLAAGLIGGASLVASLAGLVDQRAAEVAATERANERQAVVADLVRLDLLYGQLKVWGLHPRFAVRVQAPNPPLLVDVPPRTVEAVRLALRAVLRDLKARPHGLESGPTAGDYGAVVLLASRALSKPPTPREAVVFQDHLIPLTRGVAVERDRALAEAARLYAPPPLFLGAALSRRARPSGPPPAGASAVPNATAGPPRTRPSTGSAPGTR